MKKYGFLSLLLIAFTVCSCSLFNSDNKEKITSISFEKERIEIYEGDVKSVGFTVLPESRVTDCEVTYTLSDSSTDIVSLSSCTSSGLIISGEHEGSVVLIATCEGLTSYMEIDVISTKDKNVTYIKLNDIAYELDVGQRKTFQVSLSSGHDDEKSLFEWETTDSNVIDIETADNACIITAKKAGFSKIIVSHPRSDYKAACMVYVNSEGENTTYITTDRNVVLMGSESGTENITFSLMNSSSSNYSLFTYKVTDGEDCINIITNNNICSVTPLKVGTADIEVSHSECDVSLVVHVIVVDEKLPSYIDSDKTFIEMIVDETEIVTLSLKGEVDGSGVSYSVRSDAEGVFEYKVSNEILFIKALKKGSGKLYVSADMAEEEHEIYVFVKNRESDLHYITTAQNIIRTEVGSEPVNLDIFLSGGNSADGNGFTWTVSDSSICTVSTDYGIVVNARSAYSEMYNAYAVVEPKKTGTCDIVISHPKSEIDLSVKVIVYPKGTFSNIPMVVNGQGLVKVLKDEKQDIKLNVVQGEYKNKGLKWESKNRNVCTVSGNGLEGFVYGVSSGVSSYEVSGEELSYPFSGVVICGETQEEIDNRKVMYADNEYISIVEGEKGYYQVNVNGTVREDRFSASVSDESIFTAVMSGNVLIIDGKKKGNGTVVVSNEDCLNSLVFFVEIVNAKVSLQYPYYFNNEKFVGIVNGEYKDIEAELVGAGEAEKNKITWRVEDKEICDINGNGSTCRVYAKKSGETVVYAHSDKSEKDAMFVVYTADTIAELQSRVILKASQTNYLGYVGKDFFVEIDVNDKERNRENIVWDVSDISVVKIDSNYDSAYLRCIGPGNAVVTVRCGTSSVNIFVSVVENETDVPVSDIQLPNVLEFDEGMSKTVEAGIFNISNENISKIRWESGDEQIISVSGNGSSCYIKAVKEGVTYLKVSLKEIGYEKKITCVVYKEGAAHLPVISIDRSYYNITKGETLDLKLSYGSVVPSDEIKAQIRWESSSNIVGLNSSLDYCSVTCKEEGIAVITVSGEGIYNTLSVTVACGKPENLVNYSYFSSEKVIGIVVGESHTLNVDMLDSYGSKLRNGLEYIEYSLSYPQENDEYVRINQADNVFTIEALKKGCVYLNLSHPNVRESYKVLIYTADTPEELNNIYPLSSTKTNYLLSIGDSAVLKIETVNDTRINDIEWKCSDASICGYEISGNKKNLKVTAKKGGTVNFTASCEGSLFDVVFTVSVTEYNDTLSSIYINTESIIGLKKGDVYDTSVVTNLDNAKASSLVWSCTDNGIAEINGSGLNCNIKAVKEGLCELTVKYNNSLYRTIVVYVCSDQDAVDSYYAMNIDRRYTVMRNNSSQVFYPFYARNVADKDKTVVTDVYDNNVVKFEYKDGALKVNSVNEGIARLRLTNEKTNSFDIYIVVSATAESSVSDIDGGYLTVVKNVYAINVYDKLTPLELEVIPVGIDVDKYSSIRWTNSDNKVCTVSGNGKTCKVFADTIGTSLITVSSIYSSNTVAIKIIVTDNDISNIPYIKTETNVVELKSGEEKDVLCKVENASYKVTGFSYSVIDDTVCSIEGIGDRLRIKGLKNGQTVVTVKYDGYDDVNIVVSVKGIAMNVIYLTTDDNYVVVPHGGQKSVSVSLVGYNETNQNNFTWSTDSENVRLSGSGSQILVSGVNEGQAVLKVNHSKALYPVEITVIVRNESNYKPVYMKTESNVITIKEGAKKSINVNLINGSESQYGYFSWNVDSSSNGVIRCNATNNQAVITGLSEGVGLITVSHPDCIGLSSMDILVIVEKDETKDSMYITTDSTIIEDKLSNSYKTVNVTLVGGSASDQLLFTWEIIDYESTVRNSNGTSNKVISLVNESGNQNIVKYLCEGTATVRVKNSVTSYYLDIKFIINEESNLAFADSSVEVKQFESVSVGVTSPSSKTIYYNSSDTEIATCYGTNSLCFIEGGNKTGTCIITAKSSDGVLKSEIIVKVSKNNDVIQKYIVSSCNVLTLNLSNSGGSSVTASLAGTDVEATDSENLVWKTESGRTDVVKFGSANSLECTGKEVLICPVRAGTETIVVTHPLTSYVKKIYVSVEQSSTSMVLSGTVEMLNLGDISSVTATLMGVPSSELEKIVWTSSDSSIVGLTTSDGYSYTCTGSTCVFKALGLTSDGVVLTASYGSMIKTFTVFVQELPVLHLDYSSEVVRTGQSKYINITCVPDETLSDLTCSYNSTQYLTIKKDGIIYTGLFKTEGDVIAGNDSPPEGIRVPYVKFTGGGMEGITSFTFQSGSLSALLNVTTSNKTYFEMYGYQEITPSGAVVKEVTNTSVVTINPLNKARVFYSLDPEEMEVIELRNGISRAKLSGENLFDGSRDINVSTGYDEKKNRKYLDISSENGWSNYGDLVLHSADNKLECGRIRLAFVYSDCADKIRCVVDGSNQYNYINFSDGYIVMGKSGQLTVNITAPVGYSYKNLGDAMPFSVSHGASGVLYNYIKSTSISADANSCYNIHYEYPASYGVNGEFVVKLISIFNVWN